VTWQIHAGDALELLRRMPSGLAQCCVTSPPYYGLRDYGTSDAQIGLERTPGEYVQRLVETFREVRRVLRDDGTLWLNLGDSYAGSWGAQSRGGPPSEASTLRGNGHIGGGPKMKSLSAIQIAAHPKRTRTGSIATGAEYKPKDLLGIPWTVAFALRDDGWYLRSDIIWVKPNPMPESVTDRPTSSHEHIFLLAKSARYFYDADAIREEGQDRAPWAAHSGKQGVTANGRNKRNVWEIATHPYPEAHFATFPVKLVEPCVLAGSSPGSVVLDPFCGVGTTGVLALRRDRSFIGLELNPDYVEMARNRIRNDAPLFNVEFEGSSDDPLSFASAGYADTT
jgi:DNA modification methylase